MESSEGAAPRCGNRPPAAPLDSSGPLLDVRVLSLPSADGTSHRGPRRRSMGCAGSVWRRPQGLGAEAERPDTRRREEASENRSAAGHAAGAGDDDDIGGRVCGGDRRAEAADHRGRGASVGGGHTRTRGGAAHPWRLVRLAEGDQSGLEAGGRYLGSGRGAAAAQRPVEGARPALPEVAVDLEHILHGRPGVQDGGACQGPGQAHTEPAPRVGRA